MKWGGVKILGAADKPISARPAVKQKVKCISLAVENPMTLQCL